jgi:hypothetical protein
VKHACEKGLARVGDSHHDGAPGHLSYEATEWCPTGLKMVGAAPQPMRHLINLELRDGLKLTAMVALSTVTDASCVVELKPFAMNRAVSEAWSKLAA